MLPQENHYYNSTQPQNPKLDIESLVDTRLPPSPGGIMRLTTVLRDFNASTGKIAEAINFEPALVTRILRLANSPLYALEKNVATVQQAIGAVGTVIIHDIVMMELTSATFAKSIYKSPHVRTIWKHSLAVALLSRELSKMLKNRATEEAFVCGLLHDIGKIILLSHDENAFADLTENSTEGETLRMEVAKFGYNHAEVGALVARRWGLPDEVCYSILHHHDPTQADKQMIVTYLVDVADLIANSHGLGLRNEDGSRLTHSESVIQLGLSPEQMEEAWKAIEQPLNDVIQAFAA
jgi:putative nucleotidyltransferase with HDIG domain